MSVQRLDLPVRGPGAILDHDPSRHLGELHCPALVAAAVDDAVTPAYHAQALAAAIPRAVPRLPHGGHFVMKAEPDAYAQAVLPFLAAGQSHTGAKGWQ